METHLWLLSPLIKNQNGKVVFLIDEYADLLNELKIKDEAHNNHKRELFGRIAIENGNSRFWELFAINKLPDGSTGWNKLSEEKQGEMMAFYQLQNMLETLERDAMLLEHNLKETLHENKNRTIGESRKY